MHQYRVVVAGGCGSHGAVVLDNDDLRGDTSAILAVEDLKITRSRGGIGGQVVRD